MFAQIMFCRSSGTFIGITSKEIGLEFQVMHCFPFLFGKRAESAVTTSDVDEGKP